MIILLNHIVNFVQSQTFLAWLVQSIILLGGLSPALLKQNFNARKRKASSDDNFAIMQDMLNDIKNEMKVMQRNIVRLELETVIRENRGRKIVGKVFDKYKRKGGNSYMEQVALEYLNDKNNSI